MNQQQADCIINKIELKSTAAGFIHQSQDLKKSVLWGFCSTCSTSRLFALHLTLMSKGCHLIPVSVWLNRWVEVFHIFLQQLGPTDGLISSVYHHTIAALIAPWLAELLHSQAQSLNPLRTESRQTIDCLSHRQYKQHYQRTRGLIAQMEINREETCSVRPWGYRVTA